MPLPKKLKNMNLFNEGASYMGVVSEVTLPTLERNMQEFRGGGMNAPVETDHGMNLMELSWKAGGMVRQVLEQFGACGVNDVGLRFAGAYQEDATCKVSAVEVIVRGRHKTINPGAAKPGDDTEWEMTSSLAYFQMVIDGDVVVEIDPLNFVETVNGVDRLEEQRAALGI
ncbi:phage major tail tube protein [Alloalcanivorax xenomutans]|uniref:phage major tail tube protein n=1 Tax=Alloalcanivorax xenomutans TaxID=1094342 RepID=UPI003BAC55D1